MDGPRCARCGRSHGRAGEFFVTKGPNNNLDSLSSIIDCGKFNPWAQKASRSPTLEPLGRCRMKVPSLLLALVALPPLSAVADEALVKFDGAIGADSVSAAHQGAAGTATGGTLNIVCGVQPPPPLLRGAALAAR